MNSSSILTFDPLNLTPDKKTEFLQLVSECVRQCNIRYFEPGIEYGMGVKFKMTGQSAVLFRPKEHLAGQFSLEVVGEEMVKGRVSSIKYVRVTYSQYSSKSSVSRLIKIHYCAEFAEQEYQTALFTRHMHLKKPVPVFVDNEPCWANVMRYFQGEDLFRVIKDRALCTADDLLVMARNVLYAYKEQVQDRGIKHCDIKPENLIITETNDVYIIDYEFALQGDVASIPNRGTPGYIAKELRDGKPASISSDIFAIGIVLAELLGASIETIHIERKEDLKRKLKTLFFGVNGLFNTHKVSIRELLEKMCHYDQWQRCSVEDAINVFETIIQERWIEEQPAELSRHIIFAHNRAICLRSRLLNERIENQAESLVMLLDQGLRQDLDQVSPEPAVLAYYFFMLNIKVFYHVQSVPVALSCLNNIKNYERERDCFNEMYEQLSYDIQAINVEGSDDIIRSANNYFMNVTDFKQRKLPMYSNSIDDIVELTRKLKKRTELMSELIDKLDALQKSATPSCTDNTLAPTSLS